MSAIDKRESNTFWYMKAFAVVAIVACHCTHVSEDAGMINRWTKTFLDFWIQCGVPIFFFIAGFFLNAGELPKDLGKFWIKKLKTIVVPWIITGTAVWLYIVLRKGGITFEGWFRYLFMRESYLYFLTDLLLFYLLFFTIYKNKACMIGSVVILFAVTVYLESGGGNY